MSFASWLPKRNLKGKHAKVPLGCVAVCGAAVAISGRAAGLVLCGLRAWRLARGLAGWLVVLGLLAFAVCGIETWIRWGK